jgi:hypothetical protein
MNTHTFELNLATWHRPFLAERRSGSSVELTLWIMRGGLIVFSHFSYFFLPQHLIILSYPYVLATIGVDNFGATSNNVM